MIEGVLHGKWVINAQELLDELSVAEVELKNDIEQKFEE